MFVDGGCPTNREWSMFSVFVVVMAGLWSAVLHITVFFAGGEQSLVFYDHVGICVVLIAILFSVCVRRG